MLRSCALLAVLAALALPAQVNAKGPTSLEVCGLSSCITVKDRVNPDLVYGVLNLLRVPWERFVSAPPLAPYYELRFDAEWLDDMGSFVPSAGLAKAGSSWIQVDQALLGLLERAVTDLEPLPTPELTRALTGDRPAADPSAYEVLFDPLAPAELPVGAERIEIVLEAGRPTPWTIDQLIGYYAGTGIISRDGTWFALPATLADRVEGDTGLALGTSQPPAPEPSAPKPSASQPLASEPPAADGFPWGAVGGGAAGLLVLLGAVLAVSRSSAGRTSARPS